jgi:hypothetical protein
MRQTGPTSYEIVPCSEQDDVALSRISIDPRPSVFAANCKQSGKRAKQPEKSLRNARERYPRNRETSRARATRALALRALALRVRVFLGSFRHPEAAFAAAEGLKIHKPVRSPDGPSEAQCLAATGTKSVWDRMIIGRPRQCCLHDGNTPQLLPRPRTVECRVRPPCLGTDAIPAALEVALIAVLGSL